MQSTLQFGANLREQRTGADVQRAVADVVAGKMPSANPTGDEGLEGLDDALGDGWSVCECRGSLSARGYLPVFSLALLVISVAGGRRSAKTLPQPTSRTKGCSGRQILQRVSLRRAVARVNPI